MSVSTITAYCKTLDHPLLLEYFYKGEKIDDPELFFDLNPGLFEAAFPSVEEALAMIDRNVMYHATYKLVISEYGFNLVFR